MSYIIESINEFIEEGIFDKIKSAGEKVGKNLVKTDDKDISEYGIKDINKEDIGNGVELYLIQYEDKSEFKIKSNGVDLYSKDMNINIDDFERITKNSISKSFIDKIGNNEKLITVTYVMDDIYIINDDLVILKDINEGFISNNTYLFKGNEGFKYYYEDIDVPVKKIRDNENMFKSESGIVPAFRLKNPKKIFKINGILFYNAFFENLK